MKEKTRLSSMLGLLAVALIALATTSAQADETQPGDCGWCDNYFVSGCEYTFGHQFWAIQATYNDAAKHGYHPEFHCGLCGVHTNCSNPNLVQQKLDVSLHEGTANFVAEALRNQKQLSYNADRRLLSIITCDKQGVFYSYRVSEEAAGLLAVSPDNHFAGL